MCAIRSTPFLAVLAAGLLLRFVLAEVIVPGAGFAGDLRQFQSWSTALAATGPGTFYASTTSANYPPGYLDVLWVIGLIGRAVGGLAGVPADQVVAALLKIPAILADGAIATILCLAGRRWFAGRAGLVAAALYLFIPVTWYDSALWGQVDAVGALALIAAIVLLVEGWSEAAAVLAVVAILIKPQEAIGLGIVVPILLRRHLFVRGSWRSPRIGTAEGSARFDPGALPQGPIRLATSALAAAIVGLAILLPYDLSTFAPASLADVPIVSHVAGLVGLFVQVGGQFSVLSANAYNVWALVGPTSLASIIGSNSGTWTPDTLLIGGVAAATVGAVILAGIGLLVALGLLRRDQPRAIILATSILALAFYLAPTRVHERYLFPFFASGALLAAATLPALGAYLWTGLLNTINLHAVLAGGLKIGAGRTGGFGGNGGGPGGFGPGGGPGGPGVFRDLALPFADLARNEVVVTVVAIGQTAVLVWLIAWWIVLVARPAPTFASGPAGDPIRVAPG